jgi:hypothetical protein
VSGPPDKRANTRATAINTRGIAQSNAEMAEQARRDQLVAQGLIDFNVSDGAVRALERRLAAQRGEHVAPIGDPSGSQIAAGIGAYCRSSVSGSRSRRALRGSGFC